MKYDYILTCEQQELVEQNLTLVSKTISRYIQTRENVCGLGYEDLYQEGCVALCRAAATYDGTTALFSTYAATLIRNHLLDCCRAVSTRQKLQPSISLEASEEDGGPVIPGLSDRYAMDTLIDQMQTAELLANCKRRYTGVARLGVEALELKIHGYSGADIARLYDVKPNHVGVWISRAAQKMRKDFDFCVEDSTSHS